MALVSVICSMFVCVLPLSLPSSRDLVYHLLGCFVSEKSSIYKKTDLNVVLDIYRLTEDRDVFATHNR